MRGKENVKNIEDGQKGHLIRDIETWKQSYIERE